MANTIDIFNSAKLDLTKLTGSNDVFSSIGEITESVKLQNKFISDVDYSLPENFARFGLAEEYYKSAITYIATEYPFDAPKKDKDKWVNSLTELEYHLYNKEFPKHAGYVELSSSQYIKIYSPSRDMVDANIKNIYNNGERYFVNEKLNFDDGFTFETWIKFDHSVTTDIFNINTINSSSSGVTDSPFLRIYKTATSSGSLYIKGTSILPPETIGNVNTFPDNEWTHFAITIDKTYTSTYINGNLLKKIPSIILFYGSTTEIFSFYKLGLIPDSLITSFGETGSYTAAPVFKIGSGSLISFDETRFWNKARTLEQIGRNWFTNVNGNDYVDPDNSSLIFYYKFNEGWDNSYGQYCLDYSGYKNHALINNYNLYNCRFSGSALNESGIVQDIDSGDTIYVPSLSYSTDILAPFYDSKIISGSDHDVQNRHALYKKFPSWILEQEEEREVQHLKQTIQIISSYFDDLFNKITEISNYKHLKFTNDKDKLYPFYDKILTSAGFDVTDLFSNLDFVEKVASRTETNIFDEDISKIKNNIYQNIYNNLSYILKGKGTEKSLRSFLRSYGISENLVRINLYADKSKYTISDKYTETVVKKKTITLTDSSNIFLSGATTSVGDYFTLEASVIFPRSLKEQIPLTSSVAGLFIANSGDTYNTASSGLQAYITVEHSDSGDMLCFRTGSSKLLVGSSSIYNDLYDDTVWNFAIGFKPNVDNLLTAGTTYNYVLDFRAANTYKDNKQSLSSSIISTPTSGNYTGDLRYFIGADNLRLTGSNKVESNAKFLYCNYWTKYLSDFELTSHNRDILNYGIE